MPDIQSLLTDIPSADAIREQLGLLAWARRLLRDQLRVSQKKQQARECDRQQLDAEEEGRHVR